MGEDVRDILFKLEEGGVFNTNKTLYLLDLPTENMLKRIDIEPSKNELFVFARGYDDTLKVGSKFSLLIPKKSIANLIECDVTLKYVSVNPSYQTDYLPSGYSGICLLFFEGGIPTEIVKKLAYYDTKKDAEMHDTLILTQKKVLEEISSFT